VADFDSTTIAEIAARAKPEVIVSSLPGGVPAVLVPDGYSLQALPTDVSLAERPARIKANVQVYEEDSFIKYFSDYRDVNSRIFADERSGIVLGILDYHEDDNAGEKTPRPRWCCHRVELGLGKSEEWTLWTSQNTKRMSQEEFARFLEDNSPDLLSPDPAAMIEMARSMSARSEINVESAVRTNKGATFRYNEVVKAGALGPAGEFTVPDEFTIKIPVYVGGEPTPIRARLRYQIGSGKLTMWYDLWRFKQVERASFKHVLMRISDDVEVTVLSGTPA
jgi:uncharacterized protein YfdQ (DUF2303 family)